MFWSLLLAHLLADYPLQTDKLVDAKKAVSGLAVHVAVHLIMMVLLTLPFIAVVWPYILVITVTHFVIDYAKTAFGKRHPDLVIGPYFGDQMIHLATLVVVGMVMSTTTTDLDIWYAPARWWSVAIGLLVASFVWYITERIACYRDSELQARVRHTMWPRMAVRVLIFGLGVVYPPASWLPAGITILLIFYIYPRRHFPRQWAIIDAVVPISAAAITLLIPVAG